MVHYFSMALVIWGLMIQPLAAAMPVKMDVNDHHRVQALNDSSHNEVCAHTEYHKHPANEHGMVVGDHSELAPSKMPCHGMGDQVTGDNTNPCNHCQSSDCASHCIIGSACAASCAAPGVAMTVNSSWICISARLQSVLLSYYSQSHLVDYPSRIYHPPKSD